MASLEHAVCIRTSASLWRYEFASGYPVWAIGKRLHILAKHDSVNCRPWCKLTTVPVKNDLSAGGSDRLECSDTGRSPLLVMGQDPARSGNWQVFPKTVVQLIEKPVGRPVSFWGQPRLSLA